MVFTVFTYHSERLTGFPVCPRPVCVHASVFSASLRNAYKGEPGRRSCSVPGAAAWTVRKKEHGHFPTRKAEGSEGKKLLSRKQQMLLQPGRRRLTTRQWRRKRKTERGLSLPISVHRGLTPPGSACGTDPTTTTHISAISEMPFTSVTHRGRHREKQRLGNDRDRQTDVRTGSSSRGTCQSRRGMWLCETSDRGVLPPSLAVRGQLGVRWKKRLQGIFLNTVLHMKRWKRSA